jgi:WD40 repeat protein
MIGAEPPRTDRQGDPLPPGAIARIGSVRLRHTTGVYVFAFAPDGKTLAAGDDNCIRLWDVTTGKEVRRFSTEGTVHNVTFAPDGKALFTEGNDNVFRWWDVATGKELRRFELPAAEVKLRALAPGGKRLAVVRDRTLALLDAETGKEVRRWPALPGRALGVHFLGAGPRLATFTSEGKKLALQIWESDTAEQVSAFTVEHKQDAFPTAAFSPDGRTLALGFDDAVRLTEPTSGKELSRFAISEECSHLAFSPDGGLLAVGTTRGTLALWDTSTGKQARKLWGGSSYIFSVAFSPDGKRVAASEPYREHTVRVWEVETGRQRFDDPGHTGGVDSLELSKDGKTLASLGEGGFGFGARTIRLWSGETGQEQRRFTLSPQETGAWALAPDGQTLAFTERRKALLLCDTATGKTIHHRKDLITEGLAFSPDGRALAVTSYDDRLVFLDVRQGQPIWERPCDDCRRLAFSPDGRALASNHFNGTLILWDVARSKEVRGWKVPGDLPVAFFPDGRSLVTPGHRNDLLLWETSTGKERGQLKGDKGTDFFARLSPDGSFALSGGECRLVRVWDLRTGAVVKTFEGHDGYVTDAVFSPDGRRLYSASADTTILIWDTENLVTGLPALELSDAERDGLWDALGGDAKAAFGAIQRLARSPAQTLALLKERLPPAAPPAAARGKQLERWVADLDSDDFATREKATAELENAGAQAEPALRRAATAGKSVEMRTRIAPLLQKVEATTPQRLRTLRALEALELLGTPDARRLLEALAAGEAEALLTREAKATLQSLERRAANK